MGQMCQRDANRNKYGSVLPTWRCLITQQLDKCGARIARQTFMCLEINN